MNTVAILKTTREITKQIGATISKPFALLAKTFIIPPRKNNIKNHKNIQLLLMTFDFRCGKMCILLYISIL